MPLFSAIQEQEDERRVMAAQVVLWLACVGPILAFAFVSMVFVFGHGESFPHGPVFWIGLAIALGRLALYGVAGYLVGERQAAGGVLGLALFGFALFASARAHQLISLNAAYALLGIVLILRAGRVLGLPLFRRGAAV